MLMHVNIALPNIHINDFYICANIKALFPIMQMDDSGTIMEPDASPYIFLSKALLGHVSNVPSTDICPSIKLPLSLTPLQIKFAVTT